MTDRLRCGDRVRVKVNQSDGWRALLLGRTPAAARLRMETPSPRPAAGT